MSDTCAVTLSEVIQLIIEGNVSEAEMVMNNHYHRRKRTTEELMHLFQLTTVNPAYLAADGDVRNTLGKILFHLDVRNNSKENTMYIEAAPNPDATHGFIFTIKENTDTPAQ